MQIYKWHNISGHTKIFSEFRKFSYERQFEVSDIFFSLT